MRNFLEKASSALDRHAAWIAVALVLIGTLRIVGTYSELSYTYDEPFHIANGMEWLCSHTYRNQVQPPLASVMAALWPWLTGARGQYQADRTAEGIRILTSQGNLDRTLALARVGILPFFWITCWLVFLITRWLSDSRSAALLAVLLATMTPAILAHSGLATTDMALTAMFVLAVYCGWRWIGEPTWKHTAWFSVALGLAILAKFSTLAFFPMTALFALAGCWYFERPAVSDLKLGLRAAQLSVVAAGVLLMIWAAYWFSFGPAPYVSFRVPAPGLLEGIQQMQTYNATGHLSYLMGKTNQYGWSMFFPVALGVKTPLPLLALGLFGLLLFCFPKTFGVRAWIVPSMVLGILVFSSLFSHIDIGTRHVEPVYVAFCIAGACGSLWLVRRFRYASWPLAAAILWLAGSSAAAHPDYLSYFNLLAGDRPENILVDSDLDWGQDIKLLGRRLQKLGAKEVYFNQPMSGDLQAQYGFPVIHPLYVQRPGPGWNAISMTPWKLRFFGPMRWAEERRPEERVGSTILLFYVRYPKEGRRVWAQEQSAEAPYRPGLLESLDSGFENVGAGPRWTPGRASHPGLIVGTDTFGYPNAKEGKGALHIDLPGPSRGQEGEAASVTFPKAAVKVVAAQRYRFSFDLLCSGLIDCPLVNLRFSNHGGSDAGALEVVANIPIDTRWHRFQATFTAPAGATGMYPEFGFVYSGRYHYARYVELDRLGLERAPQ